MKKLNSAGLLWRGLTTLAMSTSLVATLSGCDGGVVVVSDPYYQAWYDVYGYQCSTTGPGPGCNYFSDGLKITDVEDPYYYSHTLTYGQWDYYDSYGNEYISPPGYYWLSPDGVLYDEYGYALNDAGQEEGRDMMADVARRQEEVVSKAGKALAQKYALAEDTGLKIARALNDWATLGKSRGRTDADKAAFMKRLYGVSMDKALAAVDSAKSGDLSGLTDMNKEVANYWSTDPETSAEILKGWYGKQLSEVGVK